MYRSAEEAYGSFDFHGVGYIDEESFLNHKLIKTRMTYS
jgi:hypothetical protein